MGRHGQNLKVGDVVEFRDIQWEVTLSTPNRAVITPITKTEKRHAPLSISSESDLKRVKRKKERKHGSKQRKRKGRGQRKDNALPSPLRARRGTGRRSVARRKVRAG